MILKNKPMIKTIGPGEVKIHVSPTGDIHKIMVKDKQINLLRGNPVDGSLINLYARIRREGRYVFEPLIKATHETSVSIADHAVRYEGVFQSLRYKVTLTVEASRYDVNVLFEGVSDDPLDLFFGHDVALMHQGTVLNSEAYTVQYLDYKVTKDDLGFVLEAKQNLGDDTRLMIRSNMRTVAYSTDGFQFFKPKFKESGEPQALFEERLESRIMQYEFSYLVLQTDRLECHENKAETTFFVSYVQDYDVAIDGPIKPLSMPKDEQFRPLDQTPLTLDVHHVISGRDLNDDEIKACYPVIRHEERDEESLLSFFTDAHSHVITKAKERLVERPHGHMLIQGDIMKASTNVFASTHLMYGVFMAHTVLGNTSFNALMGDLRNPLNLHRIAGLRLYLKIEGVYRLLSVPSLFEVGLNHAIWRYVFDDDVLVVTVYGDMDDTVERLTFVSEKGCQYDLIMTIQITMGSSEYGGDLAIERDGSTLIFKTEQGQMAYSDHPNLSYRMTFDTPFKRLDDTEGFKALEGFGVLALGFPKTDRITLDLSATETGSHPLMSLSLSKSIDKANTWFDDVLNGFEIVSDDPFMSRLNDMMVWYCHNALIHYSSPHGLEQYNGAAWGTRDVTQGPFELMKALGRHDLMKKILLTVFSRQFLETGDFPQWFMVNDYKHIQGKHSHGDIIIWPLRALWTYLEATGDHAIMDELVPLMSFDHDHEVAPVTIKAHVERAITAIKTSLIKGTSLPRYGGGDWNDTLQPANHALTERMVSGWTVALLYETLLGLSQVLPSKDPFSQGLEVFAHDVKHDYETIIVKDGIPAGFTIFGDDDPYLLHPRDTKTGLKYRLLPLIRAVISGLASVEDQKRHMAIIDQHLKFPDGVRLTDDAITYHGGKNTYFTRAETAANFGREIGLQYVHAHIRYIEASTIINDANRTFEALKMIVPIGLSNHVTNALPRQSNLYFSSSDANFYDRYEAKRDFSKIKAQTIGVKGGWRIYSSGPGILIHQIIKGVFGLSVHHDGVRLSPTLMASHDGLILKTKIKGKNVRLNYRLKGEGIKINGVDMDVQKDVNQYGKPYVVLPHALFEKEDDVIQIDVPFT